MSTRHAWRRAPHTDYWFSGRFGFGELPDSVTSKIRPAMEIVPTRSSGLGLGATEYVFPETVIHAALLAADHGHPLDAVTTMLPVPPAAEKMLFAGAIA